MIGSGEQRADAPYPPQQAIIVDHSNEGDTVGGWYDTLATLDTKPRIGQPMCFQEGYSAGEQFESNYDVIGDPKDAKPSENKESYPVFTVEGCYAEIDRSDKTVRSQSVSVPLTLAATCEVTPTHEYAVVNKSRKTRSADNLASPTHVASTPPALPPPLITVSSEEATQPCENIPGDNENSAEQCRDLTRETSSALPTCNVFPLWPNESSTTADSCPTDDGYALNSVPSHSPTQPLGTEDEELSQD